MKLVPVAQLVALGLVGSRLRHGVRRVPTLEARKPDGTAVSIVIPARNEAERIDACVTSVVDNAEVSELLVVDDSSTDQTAARATAAGATVVSAPPLPTGWVGKPWALQQGLLAATGDIVIFLDADTTINPGLIGAVTEALASHDVVSLSARLATSSPLEQALSASMVTTIAYRFGPVGRRDQPRPDRVIGNGQCLAARRQWLIDEGGFTHSAPHMTDDIALVRALARRGARVAFLDGTKLVTTTMYTSAWETFQQWPRSLPMHDVTGATQRWLDAATLWLTMALPLVRLLTRRGTFLDKVLVAQRFAMAAAITGSYKKPNKSVWFSPLVDLPVVARLTWTTIKPVRSWRGRQYGPSEIANR